MKVLFVTSEHPANLYGGLGTFTREFVLELRKFAEVKCVYFHLAEGEAPLQDQTVDLVIKPSLVFDAFSQDARILEVAASFRAQLDPLIQEFKPDVIHCNDRQTYLPFRFDKNVLYSSHLIFTDLISSACLNDIYFQEVKVERCALEHSSLVACYSDFAAKSALKLAGGMCVPVVLPLGLRTENFLESGIKKCREACEKKIVYGKDKDCCTSLEKKDGLVFEDAGDTGNDGNKSSDNSQRFSDNSCKSGRNRKKLHITYFGRFENVQKGLNDFIYAVNLLGKDFKEKFNIEYSLYGRGNLDSYVDAGLFDNVDFLKGSALSKAYADADIVVMPSRYEPFGFTGLEAMAAGCLVLLPSGLGMDMYAIPDWNCLEIPNNGEGISKVLRKAVEGFDGFKVLRENALRTAKNWTWKRCVQSHLYIYNQIAKGRVSQLCSAYRIEERSVLSKYEKSSDVEKVYCAECERKAAMKAVSSVMNTYGKDTRILLLTGVYNPEKDEVPENVKVYSVLNEGSCGITVRPECLPFDDREFDVVVCSGAWETVLDPCGSLMEMQRISKKNVLLLYYKGLPHQWQTYEMEGDDDWTKMNSSSWECMSRNDGIDFSEMKKMREIVSDLKEYESSLKEKKTAFDEKADVSVYEQDFKNRKILAGLIDLEKNVPYGAVIYNRFYQKKEVKNEIIA